MHIGLQETKRTTVFLSSTFVELELERKAVIEVIQQLDDVDCLAMEYFGARADSAFEVSLEHVEKSDLYIGLVGYRWGNGITELEYRRAAACKKECLFFIQDSDSKYHNTVDSDENRHRILTFRREIEDAYYGHVAVRFRDPRDLREKVTIALANWLRASGTHSTRTVDIEDRFREIQHTIAQGRLSDAIPRLMDFAEDFATDQSQRDEAILLSFQLRETQAQESSGKLGGAEVVKVKTDQARQVLGLLSSLLVECGEAAVT